jgi:hypothetical protein
MHRILLMAGTILASSIGFALAGLVLGEAIRNSRGRSPGNPFPSLVQMPQGRRLHAAVRGYDTPELHRDDTLIRMKQSGQNRGVQ